jgi:hypothetical protein
LADHDRLQGWRGRKANSLAFFTDALCDDRSTILGEILEVIPKTDHDPKVCKTQTPGKIAMLYRIISLELDPDGSVNAAYFTGHTVELPESPTTKNVLDALKQNGMLYKHYQTRHFRLEENGDGWNIVHNKTNRAIWQIDPDKAPSA